MLAFSRKQAGEIWLTAAQSFFAVALVVNFEISVREALALLGLFALQILPVFQGHAGLIAFSSLYVVLGVGVLVYRRDWIGTVIAEARRHTTPSASELAVRNGSTGTERR